MSKDVAVVDESNVVVAINVFSEDYELAPNEVLVTNPAWVGGILHNGFFYPPQPYPSWTMDGVGNWEAPVPYPSENGPWTWDEDTLSWVKVTA